MNIELWLPIEDFEGRYAGGSVMGIYVNLANNLRGNPAAAVWREEFPVYQAGSFL